MFIAALVTKNQNMETMQVSSMDEWVKKYGIQTQ
jgi:hypothetical protein